jgi:hypothetical protein
MQARLSSDGGLSKVNPSPASAQNFPQYEFGPAGAQMSKMGNDLLEQTTA